MKVKVAEALKEIRETLASANSADAVAERFLAEAQKVAEEIRKSGPFMVKWVASAPRPLRDWQSKFMAGNGLAAFS